MRALRGRASWSEVLEEKAVERARCGGVGRERIEHRRAACAARVDRDERAAALRTRDVEDRVDRAIERQRDRMQIRERDLREAASVPRWKAQSR